MAITTAAAAAAAIATPTTLGVSRVACGMWGYNAKTGTSEGEHGIRRRRGVRRGRRQERTQPSPISIASQGGGRGEDQAQHRREQGGDQVSASVARILSTSKTCTNGCRQYQSAGTQTLLLDFCRHGKVPHLYDRTAIGKNFAVTLYTPYQAVWHA